MIAHDGRKICVGWADHEIIWLRAAIEAGMRRQDVHDIAALSGRSANAIRDMAYKLRVKDRAAELQTRKAERIAAKNEVPILAPSRIALPTMAQRMAGSTRLRTYNAWSGT